MSPDLRRLRDIHTLRWMARRVFGTRDIESLIPLGELFRCRRVAVPHREHLADERVVVRAVAS